MPDNTQTGDIDFATWRARIRNDVSSNYHQEMGIALEREGSVEAACAHFRQALALDPRLIISTDRLTDLLRRIGRDAEAEALHRRALESNPHYQAQARFDFLLRDYDLCISCYRCVRVCAEQEGDYAISVMNRGFHTQITTEFDGLLRDSSCTFCGQCVQTCPTGALGDKKALRFSEGDAL